MEQFKGLVRDTLLIKNPPSTWQHGRNMLLAKGFNSVANEDGFKFEYLVPGVVIGAISTSSDIVYFVKGKDGLDQIGKVSTNNNAPVYTTVIKTNLFNFKLNRPIEGVFIYNYKNELTVAWCDGLLEGSNTPKILNTSNPGIELNEDGTLVNDLEFNKIELFPKVKQGDLEIQYLDSGNLGALSAYVTFAYVYDDDTTTPFFSVSDLAYLSEGIDANDRKGLRLIFRYLDETFSKIKVGIVLKQDGNFVGYESYPISYTGTSKTVDITSLSNFISIAADSIIIEKVIFDRIESLTKVENQVIAGKVSTKKDIKFQKYANLLKLRPTRYLDDNPQTPSLMPDEVYAMYCQIQYLDGTYSDAFHIPGDKPTEQDLAPLTVQEIEDYNLQWTDDIANSNFKYFHIFNKGIAVDGLTKSFGVWQNEETYPNVDDYNSTVDYNGNELTFPVNDPNNPLITVSFGEDLRNTPIRYHRTPSISTLTLGENPDKEVTNSNNLEDNTFYKIGVEVVNFRDVVPYEIRSQIQGYRLCFVKRNGSNNYVVGNWIATRRGRISWTQSEVPIIWEFHNFNPTLGGPNQYVEVKREDAEFTTTEGLVGNEYVNNLPIIDFDKLRLLSNELYKFKPRLDLTYIKNNYLFTVDKKRIFKFPTDTKDIFAKVKEDLKYVPGNNLAANTQFHEEGIDLDLDSTDFNKMVLSSSHVNAPDLYYRFYVMNITAFSFKTNLYSGFRSDSLVIMGKTSNVNNNVEFKGGDVFNNNVIDIVVHTTGVDSPLPGVRAVYQDKVELKIKGLFSPINSGELFNEVPNTEDREVIGSQGTLQTAQADLLNARDYTFEVKDEADLNVINDINTIFTFDHSSKFINIFPFRIHRGIKIPNENLSSTALRTFLINDYYEMPNDKGHIIAVRGSDRKLFIQMRFSLFVASIKDKLRTLNADAYLGQTELFDRSPDEILADEKGYIGSVSKFACVVIKGMFITVNQVNGQIFTVKESVKEISNIGNRNWFRNNWDIGLDFFRVENEENRRIDNPFVSVGHLVGYDKEYNRLLFTKKAYSIKDQLLLDNGTITFDGEFFRLGENIIDFNNEEYIINKSRTLSFTLDTEEWLFEHDYYPNLIYHDTNSLFSILNNLELKEGGVYKHNDKLNKGLFYGKKFPSYVDLIFNQNLEITKLLHSVKWVCDTIKPDGGNDQFSGVTGMMVYNNNQCSGIINLRNYGEVTRSLEGEWSANAFKDLVINPASPILNDSGDVIESNLNPLKLWFEKSNFISKLVVVRLIVDNIDNNTVYIHKVNVNSIISKR